MGKIINIPEHYQEKTIENYSGNVKQVEQIKNWADGWNKKHTSIFICGPVGTGKTHLAIAAAKLIPDMQVNYKSAKWVDDGLESDGGKWVKTDKREARIIFANCVNLMYDINSGIDDGTGIMAKVGPYISSEYDAVILDDFGINKMTDHTRQILYMIIDSRYSRELSTIITSNLTLSEIYQIDQRISSRMCEMCGLIMSLSGKDWRSTNVRRN